METKIIRIGKVSSVDIEKATVKVVFYDMDDMVTTDLPILFPHTLKNKAYTMPDIGENVLCVFIEQGWGDGFCIGCFYTEEVLPPIMDQDKSHFLFSDGTYLEYDRKTHQLIAEIKGDALIKAENIEVEAETIQSTSTNLNATAKQATINATTVHLNCTNLTVQSEKDILIQSATKVILKGKVDTQVVN